MAPRLTRLDVRGYQSLADVSVPLGGLTVVEGESDVGKSALLRALRHLAENTPGTGYVTRGAASCAVALVEADREAGTSMCAVLRRHRGRSGRDTYRLLHAGPDGAGKAEFGKLGGKVPDEVAGWLRLGPLNFAGQWDPPYLLAGATGTEIARRLGELTNVTMVFEAAREAERVRKETARDLRAAQARVGELAERGRAYRGLGAQRQAAARAEQALPALEAAERDLDRFRQLTLRAGQQRAAVAEARAAAESAGPPSLDRLEELAAALARFRDLADARRSASAAVQRARERAAAAVREESALHEQVHDMLVRAGTCPTCGQRVTA